MALAAVIVAPTSSHNLHCSPPNMVAITVRAEFDPTSSASFPTLSTTSAFAVNSASPTGVDSDPATQALTKNVLEWLFLALVVAVVGSVVYRRLHALKRDGLPVSSFFSTRNPRRNIGTNTRPTRPFPSTFGSSLSAYDLADVPTAYNRFTSTYSSSNYQTRTQTRAVDVDSLRRGGRGRRDDLSEFSSVVSDRKDTLPAYDKAGSPPGYIDSLPALLISSAGGQQENVPHSVDPVPDYSLQVEVHDR